MALPSQGLVAALFIWAGTACSTAEAPTGTCAADVPGPEVPYDGHNQDCEPGDISDLDGDGYAAVAGDDSDCDDSNGSVHPGADEVEADGIDQDCDGLDWVDLDDDRHGDVGAGWDDCDDGDPDVHPDADEIPYDGIDQDCDGGDLVDVDGDGHASVEAGGTDCDDEDAHVFPGASEHPADGIDSDCDGTDGTDLDEDGYDSTAIFAGTDCDDDDASIHPGAEETWGDEIDSDCDGTDGTDADGDGFLPADEGQGDDCDDSDDSIYPGAAETLGDGIDSDCDGTDGTDVDRDGYDSDNVFGGKDCDDSNPDIHPGAVESVGDGVDSDCDGTDGTDLDGDGYDTIDLDGGDDCDDDDASVHPDAEETAYDDIDQDCDGADLTDVDGDGYDGELADGEDCDDDDASIYPGAGETAGASTDNDCDGLTDEVLVCADGTGDYTTIQDGVDGVADGSTLEICPGTYTELVEIEDRWLTIVGGGDHPDDVVIDGTTGAEAGVEVTGESSVVEVRWLSIYGGSAADPLYVNDVTYFLADTIDFCGTESRYSSYGAFHLGSAEGGYAGILRSYFCSEDGDGLSVQMEDWRAGATFEWSQNIVTGTAPFVVNPVGDGTSLIENNIFLDCELTLYSYLAAEQSTTFRHNTLVDLASFRVYSRWAFMDLGTLPSVVFDSNLLSDVTTYNYDDTDYFWVGVWADYYTYTNFLSLYGIASIVDAVGPTSFDTNLAYNLNAWYSTAHYEQEYYGYDEHTDTGLGPLLRAEVIEDDPVFAGDTGLGAYALDPSSPAVDAGSGDSDPDGSAADIGACGGPDGDWYKEVPWQLR